MSSNNVMESVPDRNVVNKLLLRFRSEQEYFCLSYRRRPLAEPMTVMVSGRVFRAASVVLISESCFLTHQFANGSDI